MCKKHGNAAIVVGMGLVALVNLPARATAQGPAPSNAPSPSQAASSSRTTPVSPSEPRDGDSLWHESWSRFRPWQYVATPLLLGGSLALRYLGPTPPNRWASGRYDRAITDALAVRDDPARRALEGLADVGMFGSMSYLVLDAVFAAGVVHGDWATAGQMLLIDLQSIGVLAAVLWTTQLAAGRARPFQKRCDNADFAALEGDCAADSGERNRGFIAGHGALVLTAAGLTCTHHMHLDLYGPPGDAVSCAALGGMAAVTNVLRVTTEHHFPSDVSLALLVGGVTGWVLPLGLHYGFGDGASRKRSSSSSAPHVSLVPRVGDGELGLTVLGVF